MLSLINPVVRAEPFEFRYLGIGEDEWMMVVSELIKKLRDMPEDALVALEINGVYALTRNIEGRLGKDGKLDIVCVKAHHIRLAVSNFVRRPAPKTVKVK
jgi:hypothetical protein